MGQKESILKELRTFKEKTSKKLPIRKMYLFGSRAAGKQKRWSDVDLIIVSEKFKRLTFRNRATKMYDYWDLDYPVDFLCYTPVEFKRLRSQPTLVREAVKNGIEV